MPTYDYRCAACGEVIEVSHRVHDPGPTVCLVCGRGPLRKTFAPPTIVFKGSGWAKKERMSGRAAKSPGSAEAEPGEGPKSSETESKPSPKASTGTAPSADD